MITLNEAIVAVPNHRLNQLFANWIAVQVNKVLGVM